MSASPKKKGYRKILKNVRDSKAIWLVGTGPRDTGQSDFKNRFTLHDLERLLPIYDASGYFAIDSHGGARLHQDMMNNMIDPFEEARLFAGADAARPHADARPRDEPVGIPDVFPQRRAARGGVVLPHDRRVEVLRLPELRPEHGPGGRGGPARGEDLLARHLLHRVRRAHRRLLPEGPQGDRFPLRGHEGHRPGDQGHGRGRQPGPDPAPGGRFPAEASPAPRSCTTATPPTAW